MPNSDIFALATFGYEGRVALATASVAYFVPLIDSAKITVSNAVSGAAGSYDAPNQLIPPYLFMLYSSVACRIRRRIVHPAVPDKTTAALFTRMTGSAGYTNVAAATDKVRSATLPEANVADGTTSLATRIFNEVNFGTYGFPLAAGTYMPVYVTGLLDCWFQIIPRDAEGVDTSASGGSFHFCCVSDDRIVGY